jgi:hypothetical protein
MKTITMVRGLTAIINRVYEGQQNQHACQQWYQELNCEALLELQHVANK